MIGRSEYIWIYSAAAYKLRCFQRIKTNERRFNHILCGSVCPSRLLTHIHMIISFYLKSTIIGLMNFYLPSLLGTVCFFTKFCIPSARLLMACSTVCTFVQWTAIGFATLRRPITAQGWVRAREWVGVGKILMSHFLEHRVCECSACV